MRQVAIDVERHETGLFSEATFLAKPQTLVWRGDTLVDLAGGHQTYDLVREQHWNLYTSYGLSFDGAVGDAGGHFAVIYQRLGTKGIVIRGDRMIREIDRSFYCADAYEFPVGFVPLPGGGLGLAHCPEEYCRLEIDDAATGERLTRAVRRPSDFFHSRLAASPSGRRLLSAGWVWHPWDAVVFFDVAGALRDPSSLDRLDSLPESRHVGLAEETSAVWLDDDRVAVSSSDETEEPEEAAEAGGNPRLRPRGIAVYDVPTGRCLSSIVLGEVAGTMMPAGARHVVSFYREPKLIELATGTIVHRWEGVDSGDQTSSISRGRAIRPLALDPARLRFAVACGETVTAIQLHAKAL
ncbi:MAG: hypothetical protein U0166_28895 [Acidobacteriota bacterium]